jgi:hypothetical protein
LALAEIMVGKGVPLDNATLEDLYKLTDLIAPFAPATSTVPQYDGDTIHMTVEYRNDLGGGLEYGQWLSEYGLFVEHPTDAGNKILFAYGTLGDRPQYVSAYGKGSLDSRRFPVSITIGAGVVVTVMYDTAAFMTAEDVAQYCTITMLPQFTQSAQGLIAQHNLSLAAHPDIRNSNTDLAGRIGRLEDMLLSNITSNPFMVTFDTLDGIVAAGVWNRTQQRIEF